MGIQENATAVAPVGLQPLSLYILVKIAVPDVYDRQSPTLAAGNPVTDLTSKHRQQNASVQPCPRFGVKPSHSIAAADLEQLSTTVVKGHRDGHSCDIDLGRSQCYGHGDDG